MPAKKKAAAPAPAAAPSISKDEVRGRAFVMLINERGHTVQRGSDPFPPSLGAQSRTLLRNKINLHYFVDVGCTVTGPALAAAGTFNALVDAIFDAI